MRISGNEPSSVILIQIKWSDSRTVDSQSVEIEKQKKKYEPLIHFRNTVVIYNTYMPYINRISGPNQDILRLIGFTFT